MTNGKQLNKEWCIGAEHALYHKDGVWYHCLKRFPAALTDSNGFVRFKTEDEYRNCQHLSINDATNTTHVPISIAKTPRYVNCRSLRGRLRLWWSKLTTQQ